MSIVGEEITIVDSRDPTKTGRKGEVVFETSKTLELKADGKTIRVEKAGSVFQLRDSKKVLDGNELIGRLEDRLRLKKA